ncbi:hypothetical protein ACK11X_20065, partial [Bacillus velezensis]|uniref:hypothetical protein n=1 Tax=Bacillus velezensis TaxID=492670 RepID=UPI003CF80274
FNVYQNLVITVIIRLNISKTLTEHFHGKEEVSGSSPLGSLSKYVDLKQFPRVMELLFFCLKIGWGRIGDELSNRTYYLALVFIFLGWGRVGDGLSNRPFNLSQFLYSLSKSYFQ